MTIIRDEESYRNILQQGIFEMWAMAILINQSSVVEWIRLLCMCRELARTHTHLLIAPAEEGLRTGDYLTQWVDVVAYLHKQRHLLREATWVCSTCFEAGNVQTSQ